MKWLSSDVLERLGIGLIQIFDKNDLLCSQCSYPKGSSDSSCHSCNIFMKRENIEFTGGVFYFDKNISIGEYYDKEKWRNSLEPKYNLSKLIIRAKNNQEPIEYCARIIRNSILNLFPEIMNNKSEYVICAVPDYKDKFQKGLFLAQELSKLIDIKWVDTLIKNKDTNSQRSIKSIKERFLNVKGIFEVKKGKEDLIRNKNILLVDDIMSTMATQNECSKKLKQVGAKRVISITIGRHILSEKVGEN
jgi:competence protein ComFC